MSAAQEIKDSSKLVPDYVAITKSILSSQPPCAADLESHVKFCRTWGGGKEQLVTLDVCNYIKTCPTYFKVTSAAFDVISSLKCDPTNLPTRFVAACVKTIATRGVGRDGNGVVIASKDLKAVTGDKKEKCLTANQFMERAVSMCTNLGVMTEDVIQRIGWFECDLVEHVFDTFPNDHKLKKMGIDEIVKRFLHTIDGKTEPDATKLVDTTDSVNEVFNSTGSGAVQKALERVGVTKGALLQLKQRQPNLFRLDTQFEVAYINDDGSIGLRIVKSDGKLESKLLIVKMDDVVHYVPMKKELRLKELPLSLRPDVCNQDHLFRAVAEAALSKAYKHYKISESLVYIQGSPRIRVLARCTLAAKQVTFVPWTCGLGKPVANKNDNTLLVQVMTPTPVYFELKAPGGLGKTVEVEYWRVQTERNEASMGFLSRVNVPVDVAWPFATGMGPKVVVNVPVLVVNQRVEADWELKVFEAKVEKKRKLELSMADMTSEKKDKK